MKNKSNKKSEMKFKNLCCYAEARMFIVFPTNFGHSAINSLVNRFRLHFKKYKAKVKRKLKMMLKIANILYSKIF